MSEMILLHIDQEEIATITLNRPEMHNAFDDVFINNFLKILESIQNNSAVRLVILKANGKSFSAGGDLNWMQRMINYTFEENLRDSKALAELLFNLNFLNKPTIAVVQGSALGGGVGLVAACDIAIASHDAYFSLSEVKVGLVPAVISPYVISAIGERQARRYFLTAERFNAETALAINLIHEIVAPNELENKARELSNILLQNGPKAIVRAKEIIFNISNELGSPELKDKTASWIATQRISAEGQEGLKAFLEKRKPNWLK